MLDHAIPKPARVAGYALHQLVEGVTDGERPLFIDRGDHLLVRTDKPITLNPTSTRTVKVGDVIAFELRACVAKKRKGKSIYFPISDWHSRHEWLNRKAQQNGFEVLTVRSTVSIAKIEKSGKRFAVDQTDFLGVMRVTNEDQFETAMAKGVGSLARAFGFGMLHIN
jgi:CRISPR-associated protein Cas6/Cse3/CasE subtype I-E